MPNDDYFFLSTDHRIISTGHDRKGNISVHQNICFEGRNLLDVSLDALDLAQAVTISLPTYLMWSQSMFHLVRRRRTAGSTGRHLGIHGSATADEIRLLNNDICVSRLSLSQPASYLHCNCSCCGQYQNPTASALPNLPRRNTKGRPDSKKRFHDTTEADGPELSWIETLSSGLRLGLHDHIFVINPLHQRISTFRRKIQQLLR